MYDNIQMPRYQSIKKVWALQIASVDYNHPQGQPLIAFVNTDYAPRFVKSELFARYKAVSNDYYVQYEDGCESISPAKAFEEGYVAL